MGADPDPWWPVLVLLPIHVGMVLAFELPDHDSDAAACKTVLAVRLGPAAKRLVPGLSASAWAIVLVLSVVGVLESTVALATVAGLPAAVLTVVAIDRSPHLLTSSAVATLVLAASGLLVARIT